jgi:hypothetical protein
MSIEEKKGVKKKSKKKRGQVHLSASANEPDLPWRPAVGGGRRRRRASPVTA